MWNIYELQLNFIGICKDKYDCQTLNNKGIMDVKEQYGLYM